MMKETNTTLSYTSVANEASGVTKAGVGLNRFCCVWPFASVLFSLAILLHVASGCTALLLPPQSRTHAASIPIPHSATCMRVTRHADYTTVDAMVGTPAAKFPLLLRLDRIIPAGSTERAMRLFSQGAVESSTVSCSLDGVCSDVMLLADGKRDFLRVYYTEFGYRHPRVESSRPSVAYSLPSVKGEMALREGTAYWLTATHFCYASNFTVEHKEMQIALSYTGGILKSNISSLMKNEVTNGAPAVSGVVSECADYVEMFPKLAALEATWLSISDGGLYNSEPTTVESRRTIAEVGVGCSEVKTKLKRYLMLYLLDCLTLVSCRNSSSIPFRRLATSSMFFDLTTHGSFWLWVEKDMTLFGLPKLADSDEAFYLSIMKMLMVTIAASVVFVRSKKNTASSSWLFKNCISISRGSKQLKSETDTENQTEDKYVGVVAVASRFVAVLIRMDALVNDEQLRVCVVEIIASVLSLFHWLLRWYVLMPDKNEPPASKLGGSTAIVDSTAAVMMAFSESPTLAAYSNNFDPTARMLVALLVSIIVLTRCAFSAACCGALWPTMNNMTQMRVYSRLLLLSGVSWCIQSTILGITVCDLFVTPAAYEMSRSLAGNATSNFVLRLCLFLAIVCAGLPRLMLTARHTLSDKQHVD